MSTFSTKVKIAAAMASLVLPACKERNNTAEAEPVKQTIALNLPDAALTSGNAKMHVVRDGDSLTTFIGSQNLSKINALDHPMPFGYVLRGEKVNIIESGAIDLRPEDKVYIFPDLLKSFESFNSSQHGNSQKYSAAFYAVCQSRITEILGISDERQLVQQLDSARELKSKFMPVFSSYKVKSGDTLSEISEQILKSAGLKIAHQSTKIAMIERLTGVIMAVNNVEPKNLKVGQKLSVPTLRGNLKTDDFLRSASDEAIRGLGMQAER